MPNEPDQGLFDPAANPNPVADPVATPVVPAATPTTPSPDLFADQLTNIKGPDGQPKYESVPKALDALGNSQTHISNLENEAKAKDAELAQLKEQVAKNEAVEDVVARLTATNEQVQETPQSNGLDQEAVLTLVNQALNAEKNETVKQGNLNSVYSALSDKYGEKARDVIADKVNELNTTTEQLKVLASENPNLVLALFEASSAPASNPTSSNMSFPTGPTGPKELEKPKKSLLSGATSREQSDFMAKIKADVYEKHGVTE